jgi:hypothetical protein
VLPTFCREFNSLQNDHNKKKNLFWADRVITILRKHGKKSHFYNKINHNSAKTKQNFVKLGLINLRLITNGNYKKKVGISLIEKSLSYIFLFWVLKTSNLNIFISRQKFWENFYIFVISASFSIRIYIICPT